MSPNRNTSLNDDFETRVSISEATGLGLPDIQYITKEFIPALSGGGRRGTKLKYSKKALVEFAITKRLMNYSITIKTISQVIKQLRAIDIWINLYNNDEYLSNDKILTQSGRAYLYIFGANPESTGIAVLDADIRHAFELNKGHKDMLVVDITDELLLAKPRLP